MFGLEALSITQKMRGLEGQVEKYDAEKLRLEEIHQLELEGAKNSLDAVYVQMDELNLELVESKTEKNTLLIEVEKLKVEVEQSNQNLQLLEDELLQFKERFRSVNSELKVYKSSSYTRYEVKHMVDELNRYRIKEKQAQYLEPTQKPLT
jgi:chromosome segregation ATPase